MKKECTKPYYMLNIYIKKCCPIGSKFCFCPLCLHDHSTLINTIKPDLVIHITLTQSSLSHTLKAFASCRV